MGQRSARRRPVGRQPRQRRRRRARAGAGPQPPNFEELLRRGQDRFRRVLAGRLWQPAPASRIVVLAIVVLWLASGFYRVLPDEVGVVLRFGAYNRTTQPGLNYHLPTPIETVLTPSVTRVNRTEIGYRNAEGPGRGQAPARCRKRR